MSLSTEGGIMRAKRRAIIVLDPRAPHTYQDAHGLYVHITRNLVWLYILMAALAAAGLALPFYSKGAGGAAALLAAGALMGCYFGSQVLKTRPERAMHSALIGPYNTRPFALKLTHEQAQYYFGVRLRIAQCPSPQSREDAYAELYNAMYLMVGHDNKLHRPMPVGTDIPALQRQIDKLKADMEQYLLLHVYVWG